MIRSKIEVSVSRTIQLYQYEPYAVAYTSTLTDDSGVTDADVKKEAEKLDDLIDLQLSKKVKEVETLTNSSN